MLRVELLCTGRMKETYYKQAFAEYQKRLSRFCDFSLTELPETGDREREGAALLRRIPARAWVVALCVEGERLTSPALAALVGARALAGDSRLCLLVGGSEGLSEAVKTRSDFRLSMSDMTFPHHLARVMLAEQLYRAFTILEGSQYHK